MYDFHFIICKILHVRYSFFIHNYSVLGRVVNGSVLGYSAKVLLGTSLVMGVRTPPKIFPNHSKTMSPPTFPQTKFL